jgi:hypothetical protein
VFGALALLATTACLATPVSADRSTVNVGPFAGALAAGYDDVNGRFSLRVGGMRTATMSSKILWLLPSGYVLPNDGPNGETRLVVTGRRLGRPVRRFKQVFLGGKGSTDQRYYFPSILKPPAVGCWRLTFRAGTASGSATMLARPRYRG